MLDTYIHMVNTMRVSSDSILIMLLNRSQSLKWRASTVLPSSSNIWRTSYYGFIQSELCKYYPLILKNCPEILNKRINPIFLTFESAQYLISRVIEYRRQNSKALLGITSYTDRIAIDLAYNIVKAATSDIPLQEIADRLYKALGVEDLEKKQVFNDLKCILEDYRNKCIQLGVFDFGIAIELYNRYLLPDYNYRQSLIKRVHCLMADNIEECVPTQVDLIRMFIDNKKLVICAYNPEGGYGKSFGANHGYVKQNLVTQNAVIIETNKSYTCNKYMSEFSEMLFDNIYNASKSKFVGTVQIERHPTVELRSEMLEQIGYRICKLISEEGFQASDIAVLSTYADPVTEFVIGRIVERAGFQLKNLVRSNRIVDNPFSQALITLGQLCHPQYNIQPNRDDIKCLLSMILRIDPIRSSILAEEICLEKPFAKFPDIEFPTLVEKIGYYNIEKYEHIKKWIQEYKDNILPINEFFQKVFCEILISKEPSDISQVKNLIDSAQNFIESVSCFNINASKDFLNMVARGIKASESIFELEEKLSKDAVIMTTPVNYLANSLKHKIIILTSLSSKNWSPRSIKELTNIHVLTKTWDFHEIYTEELEEKNQREYLAILIRAILKKCSHKLITFESSLSGDGYENEGLLSLYFDEILNLN